METFAIKDLTFTYPKNNKPTIKNINFNVNRGELIVLCGKSGCGKSTLLRNFKTCLSPHGTRTGEILFYGKPLDRIDNREQAGRIGYVLQNPDNQIVTDKVWHELAFGLENLGYDSKTIKVRVSEMASFFGIQTWFDKKVTELSGGQKQILNLAAVMVMQPDILILDEPTSQLDPIAASDFLETIRKVNREIGTTVIITEHRLENVLPMAGRVLVMDKGKIIIDDTPENTGVLLAKMKHHMFVAMPSPLQAYSLLYEEGIGKTLSCPLDVGEGRKWLNCLLENQKITINKISEIKEKPKKNKPVVEMKDVWFRYSKNEKDVVKDLAMKVYQGELFCIVGGNGTGKTTALTLISGINKAYRGKIKIKGKEIKEYKNHQLFSGLLGVLPQNPQAIFVENTVEKDLYEMLEGKNIKNSEKREQVLKIAKLVEIDDLMKMHPYDLSGGEQQRAALAKILLLDPELLLLDEPTKGIDNYFKEKLADILFKLRERGVTIIVVSHDIEFCGKYADRCAMFFDGSISTTNAPKKFFSGNSFYTTAANRMSRHIFKNAVTAADVAELCRANLKENDLIDNQKTIVKKEEKKISDIPKNKPLTTEKKSVKSNIKNHKVRNKIVTLTMLVLMPITLFMSFKIPRDRGYFFVSLLMIIYIMVPFFLSFERRKPYAREIIVLSVLIALGVAGRAAFFMLPQVKPIVAITIIAGITLGANSGFLVGAMIAFISNFMFGQGAWTPWQMFALGIIGFIAGLLAHNLLKSKKTVPMMIFGFISAFLIYGGIVDLWTIFGFTPTPNLGTAIIVYSAALPFDLILAIATALFLAVLTKPMVEKIERIKVKYGLLEK